MLRLEYTDADGNKISRGWHYSEPLSEGYLRARVLSITADGDELDLLVAAIRATIKPVTVIDVKPQETGKKCGNCHKILADGPFVLEPEVCGHCGARN